MERRLAAILVADIAGYSALTGRDEAGTIAAYKGHFSALEPITSLHGGRVVKTIGDRFLAEGIRNPIVEGLRMEGMPE